MLLSDELIENLANGSNEGADPHALVKMLAEHLREERKHLREQRRLTAELQRPAMRHITCRLTKAPMMIDTDRFVELIRERDELKKCVARLSEALGILSQAPALREFAEPEQSAKPEQAPEQPIVFQLPKSK